MRIKYTQKQRDRVIELFKHGTNWNDIEKKTGVKSQTARNIVLKQGLRKPRVAEKRFDKKTRYDNEMDNAARKMVAIDRFIKSLSPGMRIAIKHPEYGLVKGFLVQASDGNITIKYGKMNHHKINISRQSMIGNGVKFKAI